MGKHYSLDDLMPIVDYHLVGREANLFIETIKELGYKDLREFIDLEFFNGSVEFGANPKNDIINKTASRIMAETQTERRKEVRDKAIFIWDSLTDEKRDNFNTILLKIYKVNFEEGLYRIKDRKLKLEFKMWLVVKLTEYIKVIGGNTVMEDFVKWVISVPIIPNVNLQDRMGEESEPKITSLHYWKHSPEKLQELYDLLLIGKTVAANQSFFQSFQKFEDKDRVKTEWLLEQRNLFCLMYLLYGSKPTYEGESISDICVKLFTVKGIAANYKSTKENFKTFLIKAEDKYYLNKKHAQILEIVSKLSL
jgi:hypothetical protein